jgi:P27 family predicted phage terminase small subunit
MGQRGPLPRAATGNKTGNTSAGEPLPPPPDWLLPGAAAEYRRIADTVKTLTAADSVLLAIYAQAVNEAAELSRKINPDNMALTSGAGGQYVNPLVNIRISSQKTIERCADKLGLSPAARARSGSPAGLPASDSPTGPAAFAAEHGADAA